MASIVHAYSFLEHVLFREPKTRPQHRVRLCLLLILFLIGIAHWVGFFNAGNLSLTAYDWVKESAYLNILREAQTSGVIPWQWSEPYYHDTRKFLANPEIILTPDIVLLRWFPNGIFVTIHVLLFYSVGFFGSLLVSRKMNASFVAFLFFWLVFNFNGFLTAHLAVGHFQWTGYFLLPFFFIILFRFLAESQNATATITSSLGMALLLGMLFLNGSFHIAVWCSMFMIITVLWRRAIFTNVVTAIIIGGLLGLGRLLPATLWFPKNSSFISGYPSFGTMLDALTILRGHDFKYIDNIKWWEYDIYVGPVALIVLIICFALALKRSKLSYQTPLFFAGIFMLMLALGNVYGPVATIPFAGFERVSSRFIIMPFMLFLITATAGIDDFFRFWPKNSKVAALSALPFIAWELELHSLHWRVNRLEGSVQQTQPLLSLVPTSDQVYIFTVYASWFITLISLIVVLAILFRNSRTLIRMNTGRRTTLVNCSVNGRIRAVQQPLQTDSTPL